MDEAQNYESKMPAYLLWTKRVRVVQGAMCMVWKGQAMTLAGYQRSGQRKRSNLATVKSAVKKLFVTVPAPLTIQQLRQAVQAQAKEGR